MPIPPSQNFQHIPPYSLSDNGRTLDFYLRKIDCTIFTKVGLSFISLLSLTRLISKHKKASSDV